MAHYLPDSADQAMLGRAIAFAATKHAGQLRRFDEAGAPYMVHPLRVMLSAKTLEERIVSVLHDTLEDTDATVADLVEAVEPTVEILEALVAITKVKGETHRE